MSSQDALTAYLRDFCEPEDAVLREVRSRSDDAGIPAVPQETGATLRWFAASIRARSVVEIGAGGGYSGLWLLGGMDPKGRLLTIDVDPENLGLARRAFTEAKVADRVRPVLGQALAVLPRLADGNYDLVFVDGPKSEYRAYLDHAKRLLRPQGLLLADNVLWSGRVPDPSETDEDTEALRAFNAAVRDDPQWAAILVPVGDGILAAVHQPEE